MLLDFRIAVEAFQKFLQRAKSFDLCETLEKEEVFSKMEDTEDYPEAFTILARYVGNILKQNMSKTKLFVYLA